jgi:hypothetical protein
VIAAPGVSGVVTFEALVQVDVENEFPAEIRLVELRVLAEA